MKIDKKRLLNIFLEDLEKNCPEAVRRDGWIWADKYLTSKGYQGQRSVRLESRPGSIKFKLFHFPPFQGGDAYWLRLDRDTAEKILVFGQVPDLSRKLPDADGSMNMKKCSACGKPIKTSILRQCAKCIRERKGI